VHRSPEYVVKLPLIVCVIGQFQASCGGTPGRAGWDWAAAVELTSTSVAKTSALALTPAG